MQPAKEEDDGGGGALKDYFAKDLSFVIFLLVSNYPGLRIILLVCLMDFLDFLGQYSKGMV